MEKRFEIRKAVRADVPVLVDFNAAMAHETEGLELDRDVLQAGVEAIFDDPGRGFYLVALSHGEVVGSLMVTTELRPDRRFKKARRVRKRAK
jgi:hypothetical protein